MLNGIVYKCQNNHIDHKPFLKKTINRIEVLQFDLKIKNYN